jgi:lysophospholipase L1-like esterase
MIYASERKLATALLMCLAMTAASAQRRTDSKWVSSWAASQQLVEPQNSIGADDLADVTLRQIVHLSIAGPQIRIRLSNRFGTSPLSCDAVHIARPISPASNEIARGSDTSVRFFGRSDVTIPAGADYISDPIAFPVAALSDVAITIHFAQLTASQTGHPGSRATSYLVHRQSLAAIELTEPKKIEHWYFIAAIEVLAPASAETIVTLGESITDGHGATTNGNDRWPDVLARRFQADARTRDISVLNQGIGGNRLLLDGLGPNALARFDHDVLGQPAVRYVILLEGINDIGTLARTQEVPDSDHDSLVQRMEAAYEQIVTRAHSHGIKVFGATILPFAGSDYYHPSIRTEKDRRAVNEWIRARGHFDAVIDFDKLMRDPRQPERLLPKFDSGDHLHPSPAGYQTMGNAVPLSLFTSTSPKRAISSTVR